MGEMDKFLSVSSFQLLEALKSRMSKFIIKLLLSRSTCGTKRSYKKIQISASEIWD